MNARGDITLQAVQDITLNASAVQTYGALKLAAGAASAELMAPAMIAAIGWDKNNLSEDQKQTISALATLAAGLAGGLAGGSTADAVAGAQAGKNALENNALNASQSLSFDKELSDCRKSGGDCQLVIDKWKQVSDKQSAETDQKLKDNPLEAVVVDKELAQSGVEMAERPGWLGNLPGVDVMSSEEAKAYVQQWNGQDLANIDVNSPGWTKFAAFVSDPQNQAAVASLGILGLNIFKLAKTTVSNIAQGGASTAIKSMQTGLRNPQQVDQIKNDMISGDYRFNAPEGRIAGYIDSKGNYYISEGNHRIVAAQEIYKKTGDKSFIDRLLQNGSWTQTKNAPVGLNLCRQGSDEPMENAIHMKKNEIYVKMLSLSLPYIRNIQSLGKKDKGRDTSCYFEAELVHNLMHTLLISDFVEHDLWFLNNQAKYYFEKCSEDISPNYNQQIEYIRSLFKMVPVSLKNKLLWQGP